MENLIYTLVRMGAHEKFIRTSTVELAKECAISQQTASRKLIELEQRGFIERKIARHGQSVRLTQKAILELRDIYKNIRPVFEHTTKAIVIEGKVFSGMGEGGYYVSMPGYRKQFIQKLGFDPFPGTLNIKLESQRDLDAKAELEKTSSIRIEGFSDDKRTYGAANCYKSTLGGIEASILAIERTHHPADVIEIISPHNLRKKLKLMDGSVVRVKMA